VTMQQRVI